jgi:hypothetical protein
MPSSAIEDEIERLIAMLDERQAASEDLEPDPDYEDGADAETETWPEWNAAKVVLIRLQPKSDWFEKRRIGDSSGCGN